jgi:thiol:disulfide interchange protein
VHEVKYTRAWQRFLVRPFNLSQTIFIALASLVAIALAIFIGVEYKKQHVRHVLAGVFVFILILAFMTANIIMSGGLTVILE